MGRHNDMSDWLIRFKKRQDSTPEFKKKTQIKYTSSNSTLECNLIEGPFTYKVTGVLGDLWGSSKKYLSIGNLEI